MKPYKGKWIVVFFSILAFVLSFRGTSQSQEINIGLTMPLTGKMAAIGIDCSHGANVAAKEINDEGGVNISGKRHKVIIRSYDDEGIAAKAVAGMEKLKEKYGVSVIIQNISGSVMAMLEKNERLGILIIGFFKHPDATKKGNRLILRHQQTIFADAMDLANAAVKIFNAKSYALLSDTSDYGKSSTAAYREAFGKLGIKEVAVEWLDARTQTDFRAQLTKIKAAQPDIIMLTAYDEASAGVVKQAHELGIKTPFALSTGFGATAESLTGPDLIEGYIKRLEFTSATPWPPAVARYRTQLYPAMGYKEPVSGFQLNTYASVHIIARAMEKAGTATDAYKIRQAVPLVVPLPEKYDTTGLRGFTEEGEGLITARIGKYHKGKLVSVE